MIGIFPARTVHDRSSGLAEKAAINVLINEKHAASRTAMDLHRAIVPINVCV
jgi:hypothetical protein